MFLHGLPLGTLAAVGAAAAGAIALLYVLELRRRSALVPFARIWERVLATRDATRLFSRLRRLLSLLVQLALLALLVVALGDPRPQPKGAPSEGRHLVVLVDASASMQAIDVATPAAPARTRLDDARDAVRALARGLGPDDAAMVVQMDATVTPLTPFTAEVAELERATASVRATDARADLPRALRFALDALRGLSSPEVVVVSDGALGEPRDAFGEVHLGEVRASFVPVGARGRNVAITAFSARRYPLHPDRHEVLVELTSRSERAEDVELELVGDGQIIDVARLRLEPGATLPRVYADLSGARRTLEARLSLAGGERDFLPADDRAYARLPEPRRVRVLAVGGPNTYLEAALLLGSWIDVTYLDPKQWPPAAGARFDVTVFDGVTPDGPVPSPAALYLDPRGPSAPVGVDEAELRKVGFDTLDRKSPLLRWTSLDDVFVGRAHRLVPRAGDHVVGASDQGALLVEGRREGLRFVALGFDPRASDLVLRTAWPVFVLDVLRELSADDASYLASFRTGEVWSVPLPAGAGADVTSARLRAASGAERPVPVRDGRAVLLGVDAGFFSIVAGDAEAPFAANLADPDESAIAPRRELVVDGKPCAALAPPRRAPRATPWVWLLVAALVLSTLEWATYHRRVTV